LPRIVNGFLWFLNDMGWRSLFRGPINQQRAAFGLAPIDNLTRYVFTDRPWLAADPVLAPAASTGRKKVLQTGAFFLHDSSPLPDALERFLHEGAPPVLFGFGSRTSPGLSAETLLRTARKIGRRAILSQGWSSLEFGDAGPDYISIGDVDYEKLLPRVAAVVHHGGSGTTTAAARAGKPQVIVPHVYDQFYWANRVKRLGIGESIQKISQFADNQLAEAIRRCLTSDTESRAQALSTRIDQRGVAIAADNLTSLLQRQSG
jgi:vancomycin aglycone glucosyltransferase